MFGIGIFFPQIAAFLLTPAPESQMLNDPAGAQDQRDPVAQLVRDQTPSHFTTV